MRDSLWQAAGPGWGQACVRPRDAISPWGLRGRIGPPSLAGGRRRCPPPPAAQQCVAIGGYGVGGPASATGPHRVGRPSSRALTSFGGLCSAAPSAGRDLGSPRRVGWPSARTLAAPQRGSRSLASRPRSSPTEQTGGTPCPLGCSDVARKVLPSQRGDHATRQRPWGSARLAGPATDAGMRRRGGEAMSPTWARGSVPSELLLSRLPPGPGSEPGRPVLRSSSAWFRSGETPSRPQPPRSVAEPACRTEHGPNVIADGACDVC